MDSPGGPRILVVSEDAQLVDTLVNADLPIGRPVVILIGGAGKLDGRGVTPDLVSFVRDGVLATANSLGATVIDGGTDAGVMRLAGSAHRDLHATIPLVGVAPLGRISAPGIDNALGTIRLEPHHTHAVLAPGTDWGDESPWLVAVARALSGGQPVVSVLIDGGDIAGREVNKIRAEGWPVITLAGSGRTADDLAAGAARRADRSDSNGMHVVATSDGASSLARTLRHLLSGTAGLPAEARIEYPALYVAASEAAKRGRRLFMLLTGVEYAMTLLALGVALMAVVFQVESKPMTSPEKTAVLFLSVGAFLFAFVLKLLTHSLGYDEDWLTGRAIAESVKSQAWRYMTRVRPYDREEADTQFAAELGGLVVAASGIRQAVDRIGAAPQQISASMRRVRALDLTGRRSTYTDRRLREQTAWYKRRAARHQASASRWFWLSIAFHLLAALSAFLAVHYSGEHVGQHVDWSQLSLRLMALLGAGAIAIAAWTQLNRDEELARAYGYTLHELALIADSADRVTTEEGLDTLVRDGEEAIGREHKTWVARRAERTDSPDFVAAE